MLLGFLHDVKFFLLLLAFDEDLAENARQALCPLCKSPLHRADYPRKPQGGPQDPHDQFNWRFSFCCSQCRKRLTPPSFRFFGRKVYFSVTFLLISAMLGGASPGRRRKLLELCGADERTLRRWKKWWVETFARSGFWKDLSGRFRFMKSFLVSLPRLLIRSLRDSSLQATLVRVLKLLLPLTKGGGAK